MTVTTNPPANASGANQPAKPDLVTITVDGFEISAPKGTLVIRAAEFLGIQIPRFCEHPLLDPVGACRQCLVEVEGQRKPMASCTTVITEGMVVKTQYTSEVAEKAQHGVIELTDVELRPELGPVLDDDLCVQERATRAARRRSAAAGAHLDPVRAEGELVR